MIKRILPILLVLALSLIPLGCGSTSGETGGSSPKWNEDGYTSLGGASLGQTEEEVKSALGDPDWSYSYEDRISYFYCLNEDCSAGELDEAGGTLSVFCLNGQVEGILFYGGYDIPVWEECPNIAGIRPGNDVEKIVDILGYPEKVAEEPVYPEGTVNVLLYPSKNCFFSVMEPPLLGVSSSFFSMGISTSDLFEELKEEPEESAGLRLQPSICHKLQ